MRTQTNAVVSRDSGAFQVDGNLATLSGYGCLAGGVILATAVGMAVAPVPTVGLCLAGGGLVAAGNFETIKGLISPKTPPISNESYTEYDITEGGKYQSADEMGDTATVVA